jgi:predicted transcriptional regulator
MGIIELKKTGQEVKPIALYNRIVFDFSVKGIPAQNSERKLSTN